MTRSLSPAARRAMVAAGLRAKAAGLLPMPRAAGRRLHPEWPLHYVRQTQDGRHLNHHEAAVLFASEWWSKQARYVGTARGLHCWERPPESERPR